MKIRAITLGVFLEAKDFEDTSGETSLATKLSTALDVLQVIKGALESACYEVQTIRISLNTIEEWLPIDFENGNQEDNFENVLSVINKLVSQLERIGIDFCSLGGCQKSDYISMLPRILAISSKLNCSARFHKNAANDIAPSYEKCLCAAKASLEILETIGELGNFRYCASFNCPPGIPFFPASFHDNIIGHQYAVSIGLESADLLFLGFFAADSAQEGRDNLYETMKQTLSPINGIVRDACGSMCDRNIEVSYLGIDASINPGLSLPDSVGAGLEALLFPKGDPSDMHLCCFYC